MYPATNLKNNHPIVAVVIPCLNESESVFSVVKDAFEGLALAGVEGQVLVADNGSDDDSAATAAGAGARVVVIADRGYGNALMGGIEATTAAFIVMGDADGSYDFRELPRFLKHLQSGAGLVLGCRLPIGGGSIEEGAMPWSHRWIGNPVFSWLARCLFGVQFRDVHCGLRGVSRRFYSNARLQCRGMEFATEMVIRAALMGEVTAEVPIRLRRDTRTLRKSHLRTWRDGCRHLRLFIRYWSRRNTATSG